MSKLHRNDNDEKSDVNQMIDAINMIISKKDSVPLDVLIPMTEDIRDTAVNTLSQIGEMLKHRTTIHHGLYEQFNYLLNIFTLSTAMLYMLKRESELSESDGNRNHSNQILNPQTVLECSEIFRSNEEASRNISENVIPQMIELNNDSTISILLHAIKDLSAMMFNTNSALAAILSDIVENNMESHD